MGENRFKAVSKNFKDDFVENVAMGNWMKIFHIYIGLQILGMRTIVVAFASMGKKPVSSQVIPE